jgi:TIR domain
VADVFVSYSRRDIELVRELHTFLTRAGREVWVDWEDIPPASRWEQDIQESLDSADSVIFVVSAASLASKYCGLELERAQKGGKRVIPLAIDNADPDAARRVRKLGRDSDGSLGSSALGRGRGRGACSGRLRIWSRGTCSRWCGYSASAALEGAGDSGSTA